MTMVQEVLPLFQNSKKSPKYLFEVIPTIRQEYMGRHKNSVPLSNVKHDCFKNSFPSLTVIEWSKIDSSIRNSENLEMHIGFHKTFRKYYFPMLQS